MKTSTKAGATRFAAAGEIPATYVALCQQHLPRPIRSRAEARVASAVVGALAGFPLNDEQADYLEAVSHFLDEHDRAKEPQLGEATGLDVLRHLLEENGLSGADLSRVLGGSRNLGAMILRGERQLTVGHIRRLAEHFGVSPAVFVG